MAKARKGRPSTRKTGGENDSSFEKSEINNGSEKEVESVLDDSGLGHENDEKNDETMSEKNFDTVDDAELQDYSPLDDEVITRGYEHGNTELKSDDERITIPAPELTFEGTEDSDDDIPSTGNKTNPQPSSGQTQQPSNPQQPPKQDAKIISNPQPTNSGGGSSSSGSSFAGGQGQSTQSNAQKRKDAIKTADALLAVYQQNIPSIFKHVAKFNEGKISRMELNGELDRNMPILEDGTTVGQYIANVNTQIENTYVITETQLDEIREPLIDWLMEKNIELTPSQRLMMAVGSQLFSFGLASFQQFQQNRHALNQFSEFHAEWKKSHRGSDIPPTREESVRNDYTPSEPMPQTTMTVVNEEEPISQEDVDDIPEQNMISDDTHPNDEITMEEFIEE